MIFPTVRNRLYTVLGDRSEVVSFDLNTLRLQEETPNARSRAF